MTRKDKISVTVVLLAVVAVTIIFQVNGVRIDRMDAEVGKKIIPENTKDSVRR